MEKNNLPMRQGVGVIILNNQNKQTDDLINTLKKLFKKNLLFELQRINDINIDSFENYLIEKSYKFNIPLIGTNNIKFGEVDEFSAHDALLCVAQKTTINSGNRKTSNNQIAFKSNDQMIDIFFDIPEIVENNFNVAISIVLVWPVSLCQSSPFL